MAECFSLSLCAFQIEIVFESSKPVKGEDWNIETIWGFLVFCFCFCFEASFISHKKRAECQGEWLALEDLIVFLTYIYLYLF